MSVIDNIGLVYHSICVAVGFVLGLLAPVITGFIIAFLLNRPSGFFERPLLRLKHFQKHKMAAHVIGVLLAFVIFLGLFVAFFYLVVPGIIDSVAGISGDIPKYAQSVDKVLNDLSRDKSLKQMLDFIGIDIAKASSISSIISEFWSKITVFLQGLAGQLFSFVINIGLFLYNFVLGLFFAVYMLIFKNEIMGQFRTLSQNIFHKSHYKLMFVIDITDDMFYRFLVGKGILSLVVGILAFCACTLAGFKYALLISIIIAVTNMIPTFGPFIAAVPLALLSLMTGPVYILYMAVIMIVLLMIDGNILGPRILGNSMGINGFWIMFSIIVMGSLFGLLGMLIAAPLFGVLRILLKNWLYHRSHEALSGEEEFTASMQRFHEWTTKRKTAPAPKTKSR
jgi:predicted PurR-regulated permease PerM